MITQYQPDFYRHSGLKWNAIPTIFKHGTHKAGTCSRKPPTVRHPLPQKKKVKVQQKKEPGVMKYALTH